MPSATNLLADLLAVEAASRVDVGGSLLGALLELRAESGVRTGDRAGDSDDDLSPRAAAERHYGGQGNCGQQ